MGAYALRGPIFILFAAGGGFFFLGEGALPRRLTCEIEELNQVYKGISQPKHHLMRGTKPHSVTKPNM